MSRQIICVDSNFVVKLIKNSSQNSTHLTLWDNWEQNQTQIIAPTLLCYEVTNVFHRMQLAKQLSCSALKLSEQSRHSKEYSSQKSQFKCTSAY
jgi:predicted nucleic acid-binding protein